MMNYKMVSRLKAMKEIRSHLDWDMRSTYFQHYDKQLSRILGGEVQKDGHTFET